jgi:hypothetical protein
MIATNNAVRSLGRESSSRGDCVVVTRVVRSKGHVTLVNELVPLKGPRYSEAELASTLCDTEKVRADFNLYHTKIV